MGSSPATRVQATVSINIALEVRRVLSINIALEVCLVLCVVQNPTSAGYRCFFSGERSFWARQEQSCPYYANFYVRRSFFVFGGGHGPSTSVRTILVQE